MLTTIDTQNRAEIMSLISNGAPMYVCIKGSKVQRVHPLIIDNAILIPVHHKGFTWIERLGKGPKESISSIISIFFQWETGETETTIADLLNSDDINNEDNDEEEED